ncbi:MAG: PAS domain S-box protein [Smithella sp.]|nr:PAS domain S-box protein [Smithella sp.]
MATWSSPEMNTKKNMQDLAQLVESLESFNKATTELQRAYARLEERFALLNRELESKNEELSASVEEKERTRNYLHNILESLINGVIVTDIEGKIQTLNTCAETLTGIRQAQAAGRHFSVLFESPAAGGGIGADPAQCFGAEAGSKVKTAGRTLEVFCSPFKSPAAELIGHVLVIRDVTQIEKLEEMAKRTEKFAAMGEMAANIAHEVRNPLGSIELYASLLLKNLADDKNRERAGRIISSVKNVDNKISNLLLFTRRPLPQMKVIGLHQVLTEVIEFSEQIIEQAGIEISVYMDTSDILIMADAEMIKQIFLNVILNAQQAMPEGGEISIMTRLAPESPLEPRVRMAEIIFQDAGPGIPAADRSRIFDPFFSTKENGSGLGLAIVHNIVSEHNGLITVDNAPQGGMVVSISLPVVQDAQL